MRERGGGYIINVSSLASFLPGKRLAVYGGSKAFLNNYSLALQQELADSGVFVQCLCPGYTQTEFHTTPGLEGFDKGRVPEELWMSASAVVGCSLDALGDGRVLLVPGEVNLAMARNGLQQQLDALI